MMLKAVLVVLSRPVLPDAGMAAFLEPCQQHPDVNLAGKMHWLQASLCCVTANIV